MSPRPQLLSDLDLCVDAVLARLGPDLKVGLPLGLGKPAELVNALYARARQDAELRLCLLTALSLERPVPGSELERAFLEPFLARVFEGVPELDYARDASAGRLPANVRVVEFFFRPGSRLSNAQAQRDHVCTNYTFAARDVFAQGCNLALQMIARRDTPDGPRYSLGSNPDTAPELLAMLRDAEARGERRVAVVGVVNPNLPFMGHDAEVSADSFDFIVDDARAHSALFPTPRTPVSLTDYAIGLHASILVRDGGTLQIGIGSLGDAVTQALILRHHHNPDYCVAMARLLNDPDDAASLARIGGMGRFEQGLYGATEMFVDGFMQLQRAGILKRLVYDFWALQRIINQGQCDPQALDAAVLEHLSAAGLGMLRAQDFAALQHHGLFADSARYEQGFLQFADGCRVIADLDQPATRAAIVQSGMGRSLRRGKVLHAGFFLGPRDFYQNLHALDPVVQDTICMTGVDKVNQLDLNPRLYREQRRDARFLNSAMIATVSGAVVSDGLADGRVVSGVGGQYNFVAQAHQLDGGRSVLMLRAVRDSAGRQQGNIVLDYAHCTIPRHLRDLLVTEYGVADLRGQTDSEVAKRVLSLADSRFQPELLVRLKASGRIEQDWSLPPAWSHNTPEQLERRLKGLRDLGHLPDFPFGTEFTDQEWRLARALQAMKARSISTPKWKLLLSGLRPRRVTVSQRRDLVRVRLNHAFSLRRMTERGLLIDALRALPAED